MTHSSRTGRNPLVVHDWDSVIAQPETAIVGLAAAIWPREAGSDPIASVAQTADFITSYQRFAGREWAASEVQDAWAAVLWLGLILLDGLLIDHEIAEVWDESAERWRLVEPEIDDGHTDPADGASFDALDVPADRFLTAPRAWQLARAGAIDPERFVTDPAIRAWPWLRHNLIHDLAALNKTEMLLHEAWGVDSRTPPGPDELPMLDDLAALTGQPSPPLAGLRSAYRRPEFVVPDTVTSYSPTRNRVPAVVDVSAVARAAS